MNAAGGRFLAPCLAWRQYAANHHDTSIVANNNRGTGHVKAPRRHAPRRGITPQAILDGLKGGNSIGQTLQSLGLSAAEAKQAERDAQRGIREAEKQAKTDATKPDKDNP